jgi:hypothetical protein
MNPLSLTKTDPVAAAAFSAELGIGKRLRAQTFMRVNTARQTKFMRGILAAKMKL